MANFIFDQPGAEIKDGTESADLFLASNNFFGAGDKARGNGGIDDFQYFADSSLTGGVFAVDVFGTATNIKTFAAFELNSVETFTTINDSGQTLVFDFSSSTGLTDVVVANSTSAVVYDQLDTLANIRLVRQTNALTTNVAVGYDAAIVAGATSVNLVLDRTNGNVVRIGTATGAVGQPTNTGIETVHVIGLGGNSTINLLDNISLTTLIFDDVVGRADNIVIGALNSTAVTTVTNNSDGGATVVAAPGSGNITFTGGVGAENFTGAGGNDTFNLGAGNNTVDTGGGTNTVTTLGGNDLVFAKGTVDTVNTGAGNDTVVDTTTTRVIFNGGADSDSYVGVGGQFNASAGGDQIDMGETGADFDVLFIDAGVPSGNFLNATGFEGIAIATAGFSTFSTAVEAKGVTSLYLSSGTAGNDTLNVSTWSTDLTITAASSDAPKTGVALSTEAGRRAAFGVNTAGGGDDTVTSGSGTDRFLWRGDNALTSADNLNAFDNGAGVGLVGDALYLNGDTTLTGAGTNGFSNFEAILLESVQSRFIGGANGNITAYPGGVNDGNVYNLTLIDANKPTAGALFINGTDLRAADAVNGFVAETVTIDASAVTAFALDISTGAAGDFITLGAGTPASKVATYAGDDTVVEVAGNTADDLIDTGLGNDFVSLTGGNNTVFDEGGNNIIFAGSGNDTILTGTGNDLIQFNVNAGATLTAADTLGDAGGIDGIYISEAGFTDARFAGVNPTGFADGYEILYVGGTGFTYTLAANAARAGFRIVNVAGDNTVDLTTGTFFDKAMVVDLSAGGNSTVRLGDATNVGNPGNGVATPANLFDFVGPITGFAIVPVGAVKDLTGNANLVIAGIGNQTVFGGTGSDVVRVNGTEWGATDIFTGGNGYDAVQFDINSTAGVTATINLANVTDVELFQTFGNGDRIAGTVDADINTITFVGGNVTTLTHLKVDNSQLADPADTTRVIIGAVGDADYAFDIFGGAAGTTYVEKQNVGINNNILFVGGAGADILAINGGDLGSTTTFNGGAGIVDAIVQTGGVISDDSYVNVSNVEILTATVALNATLGSEAAASGMTTIQGTMGNDFVLLDAAFISPLTITLSGGNDTFNATNAIGTMNFNESIENINALDTIIGGANGADTFNIDAFDLPATVTPTGDLTNVSGIEIYNVTADGGDTIDLTLGAGGAAVVGAQTFNILGRAGATNIATVIHGAAEDANTIVHALNGANRITLGTGNDEIYTGSGADQIYTGNGTNTVNAGGGADQITGGTGKDTIEGGSGADMIRGMDGNDVITGGAGNDMIYGGLGGDLLVGGADADQYLYRTATASESSFLGGRDTIQFGAGDSFLFEGANNVNYVGSAATFQDAQSSTINGDGILQAVYQSDQGILWIDINDDGALNNNDLQILLQLETGVTLTNAMFVNSVGAVTAFEAGFAPAV